MLVEGMLVMRMTKHHTTGYDSAPYSADWVDCCLHFHLLLCVELSCGGVTYAALWTEHVCCGIENGSCSISPRGLIVAEITEFTFLYAI